MANLFLVRYPEAPVPVPEKGKVTIGRAETNTIVLIEPRVSRFHSQIEYQYSSKAFTVSDLGSANGTYLNGRKLYALAPTPVADGDKIRVASSVFSVRFVNDPAEISREFKELSSQIHLQATDVINVADIKSAISQSAFLGDLEHLCAVELFQMLEYGRKTGILTLTSDVGNGTFNFVKGNVISAQFGKTRDESAVYEVLKCMSGTFSFAPRADIGEKPRFRASTTMLLMEGCRLMDEASIERH
ncbi:MAG TPA: DUF4388 domain-containing protein [Chitinivibrionales bacterium]|nr:DUF4388 domain-containing protein [Chitinivibrionales bacterium]